MRKQYPQTKEIPPAKINMVLEKQTLKGRILHVLYPVHRGRKTKGQLG